MRNRFILLAVVAALANGGIAAAFFPPVPRATTVSPPVKITGNPDPGKPPVVVASTPEPATILSGLIGLGMAGAYRLRKKREMV